MSLSVGVECEGDAASQAYDRRHPELIKAVAEGRIPNLQELITRRIALDDFVEKGIKTLIAEKDTQSKPVRSARYGDMLTCVQLRFWFIQGPRA